MSPEPTVGFVPPRMLRPALVVICTNGQRHRRRELLRLAVVYDEQGRPKLLQAMSAQSRGEGRKWTIVEPTFGADDGHRVVSKPCPSCPHHLKLRVDELTAGVAAIPPGESRVVDISVP